MKTLEILFLVLLSVHALSSLVNAWATLNIIKPENSVVADFSDQRLERLIKYHSVLIFLEVIFSGLMLIPLFSEIEKTKYLFAGLIIISVSGAIGDVTAFQTYRREQRRRQQSP